MHTIALCCAIFELSCAIYVYLHNRYNREYMTTVKAFIRTGKKDKEVNVRFRLSDGRNVQLFHKSDIMVSPLMAYSAYSFLRTVLEIFQPECILCVENHENLEYVPC